MATRVNLCPNPALDNNVTGWTGGSTPTRITGASGFVRTTAAQYTSGTFQIPARVANGGITAGLVYTGSLYLRSNSFNQSNRDLILEWLNSGGGVVSDTTTTFSLTFGVVSRISVSGTAPAGAVAAQLVIDGINAAASSLDVTAVLIEQSATADTYFDGNSAGAVWDGTAGNSTSTLSDGVTGTLAGTLPLLTASASGTASVSGTLAGTLPLLTASISGTLPDAVTGTMAGTLPALTAAMSGTASASGTLAGTLPKLTAAASGTLTASGTIAATLPALTGSLAGTLTASGVVAGTLPKLVASITGTVGDGVPELHAIRADVTGPATSADPAVDGPGTSPTDVSGPNAHRTVTGPAVSRTVSGIGV